MAQHGVAHHTRSLMSCILYETIAALDADRIQQDAQEQHHLLAGSSTSFTACIDHMLPGQHAAEMHMEHLNVAMSHVCHPAHQVDLP